MFQIIAIRAQVVIDDIQNDPNAMGMGLVHKTPHIIGPAIEMGGGKQIDAVIAPAEAPRKSRQPA